jgi:hypothetical protein
MKSDLHHPSTHLSVYQKGTYNAEIKMFNSLPVPIKDLAHNTEQSKLTLKNFLYISWMSILNTRRTELFIMFVCYTV